MATLDDGTPDLGGRTSARRPYGVIGHCPAHGLPVIEVRQSIAEDRTFIHQGGAVCDGH
jgi:hypothetical protein